MFNAVLEWIMRKRGIVHVLDDFLFLDKTQDGEYDILHYIIGRSWESQLLKKRLIVQ